MPIAGILYDIALYSLAAQIHSKAEIRDALILRRSPPTYGQASELLIPLSSTCNLTVVEIALRPSARDICK